MRKGNKVIVRGESATLLTSKGERIRFDARHLKTVKHYTWHTRPSKKRRIAAAYIGVDPEGRQRTITMSRLLFDPPKGMVAIFVNGDCLDCREENVRIVTMREAQYRSGPRRSNRTQYKGVTWYKESGTYGVRVQADGVTHYLGRARTPKEAAHRYNAEARRLQGEYAFQNEAPY